jgi:hypothetical protein
VHGRPHDASRGFASELVPPGLGGIDDEQAHARPRRVISGVVACLLQDLVERLRANRTIPFARILKASLRAEGIDPDWFATA